MRMMCVGAAIVSLLSSVVLAETKSEEISPEQVGAPPGTTELKLSMTDASMEDIVAAFNKMAGTSLVVDDQGNQRRAGPVVIYDLSIKASSTSQALDQLGRGLHVGIYNNGNSLRINPNHQEGYRDPNAPDYNEPPGVRVTNISLNRNLNAGDRRTANLGVGLLVVPGPRGIVGSPRVNLSEAVDEQGRSLVRAQQTERSFGRQRNRYNRGVTAQLETPDPMPQKIVKFKAEVSYDVPKSFTRLTLTDVGNDSIEVEALGRRVQIQLTTQGESIMLKLRAPRTANEQMNFTDELQSIRAYGADGTALQCQGRSGMTNNDWFEATGQLVPMGGTRVEGGPAPKVTTLIWEFVKDVDTVTKVVEASDLVIP